MNLEIREQSFDEIARTVATDEDRRTHDRLKLMKTMHISCPGSAFAEETGTAVDISREGMYFTVRSSHYRVGMEVKITIPSLGFQGVCRIVRTEELPSGNLGVGGLVVGW